MNKKVAAITIGCRLNQADTALIFDRFRRNGYQVVSLNESDSIDVLIVNTCTVTGTASQKSRQAVRRLRRKYPDSCIIVTGCSPETERSLWLDEPVADIVLPNTEKKNIIARLNEFYGNDTVLDDSLSGTSTDALLFEEDALSDYPFRSRAFLKIQEGCNSFCSYCIVPYARGRERSRRREEVMEDFYGLLKKGYREIILTGVNISTYRHGETSLRDLLEELSAVEGDFRIRLSSTEPHPDNMALLDVMADNPKICRFLHLPLQHGTNTILKAMNRHYTTDDYAEFVEAARKRIPDIHIGTDVIVGFPGETDELFDDMCAFVSKMAFANMHIFTYSPREGTPAADFPDQVPIELAKERYLRLSAIAAELANSYALSQKGKILPVLLEKEKADGVFEGWSDNYLKVRVSSVKSVRGDIVAALVNDIDKDGILLAGEAVFSA